MDVLILVADVAPSATELMTLDTQPQVIIRLWRPKSRKLSSGLRRHLRSGDCHLRFLRGRDLSSAVRVCGHWASEPSINPLQRHSSSERCLDIATAWGGRVRRPV